MTVAKTFSRVLNAPGAPKDNCSNTGKLKKKIYIIILPAIGTTGKLKTFSPRVDSFIIFDGSANIQLPSCAPSDGLYRFSCRPANTQFTYGRDKHSDTGGHERDVGRHGGPYVNVYIMVIKNNKKYYNSNNTVIGRE